MVVILVCDGLACSSLRDSRVREIGQLHDDVMLQTYLKRVR